MQPPTSEPLPDLLPQSDVVDLVEAFSTAEVDYETDIIDFGSSESRPHLVEGWGRIEDWDGGTSGAWAMGPRSSIQFFSSDQRSVSLAMNCWSVQSESSEPLTMRIVLNGHDFGVVDLSRDTSRTEHLLAIGSEYIVAGTNLLEFEYSRSVFKDGRPLSAFWDSLELRGLHESKVPRIDRQVNPPALVVPKRGAVSYFEMLGPETELMLQGFHPAGSGEHGRRLRIQLENTDGWSGEFDVEVAHDRTVQSVPLKLPSVRPTKVTFSIDEADRSQSGGGAVHLIRPVLTRPVPEPIHRAEMPAKQPRATPRPNIIIYLIDCLRADHVGVYGYDRPTTPNIDAFARDAVRVEQFIAQSSWTRPTVATLLTGLYPQEHGIHSDREMLPGSVPFLPQILKGYGYHTAAVITNGMVSQKFGFGRGYDFFERLPEQHKKSPEIHQLSDRINRSVFSWLDTRPQDGPFFLYIHSTDPHAPYLPRSPFREKLASDVPDVEIGRHDRVEGLHTASPTAARAIKDQLMSLYDAEIAFNDANFGDLMRRLEREGLYEDSIIIVTADHGEEFYEHGRWQHGFALYEESIHVPLLVKFPGQSWAGATVAGVTGQIDLVPTLLDYLAAEPPAASSGKSLLPRIAAPPKDSVPQEITSTLGRDPIHRDVRTVILGNWKLIEYRTYDRPRATLELYDLSRDPWERTNVAHQHAVWTGFLRTRLAAGEAARTTVTADEATLDTETEENLKALGYLN